jgi:isopenicillin-N N-acyltransferase like protein
MRPIVAAALLGVAAGQNLPTSCSGQPNNISIWDATNGMTLVGRNAYGLKYQVTYPNDTAPPLSVLHVYGSDYQQGLAYGTLLKTEINTLVPQVWDWFTRMINTSLPSWIPEQWKDDVVKYGIPWALDMTYNATKSELHASGRTTVGRSLATNSGLQIFCFFFHSADFTPAYHYDRLQGMADGSGLTFQEITRLSMIPELIKAQCSITVAWGQATINGAGKGQPIHLRALDWNTNGPFQQFPLLATFHPNAGDGLAYSTLGWAGMLGAITGMSSSGVGVGEKVWISYNGVENIFGYVWTFLLQDILQFDGDIDQAMSRIATANRTCSVWMSLTDANNNVVSR